MGQEGSRPTGGNTAAHAAERAKMVHITTAADVAPCAARAAHDEEADRLLAAIAALPAQPPAIETTAATHYLQRKERVAAEVLGHSPALFTPRALPPQSLTRALAAQQTLLLREGQAAVRAQEALARRQRHTAYLASSARHAAGQASDEAARFAAALAGAVKLDAELGLLHANADDAAALLAAVAAALTPDDRAWVEADVRRAREAAAATAAAAAAPASFGAGGAADGAAAAVGLGPRVL